VTRTLVVVNPASAGGRTVRRWGAIAHALRANGVRYETHITTAPEDAVRAVRDALRQRFERVVAVGGDGTLNEVVNGFFGTSGEPLAPDAVLGLIPSGTGGDFRRSVGIPKDPAACARIVAGGRHQRVDAGRIDFVEGAARHFINIADCGIGGEVVAAVNRSRYKGGGVRGSVVFLGISLRALLTFPGRRVRVVLDGTDQLDQPVQSVVVANGRYFGGGMHIAPNASLRDGLFDVVLVAAMGKARSLYSLPSLYRGSHVSKAGVSVRRAAVVQIVSLEDELLFDVEGGQVGHTPATITCLPAAINLCAPSIG